MPGQPGIFYQQNSIESHILNGASETQNKVPVIFNNRDFSVLSIFLSKTIMYTETLFQVDKKLPLV